MKLLMTLALFAPQGDDLLGSIGPFVPFLAMAAIFYLLILRPQQKKQKEQKAMLEGLQKGDNIVTVGGIHGKIISVKNKNRVLVVQVDNNTKLEIERSAVQGRPETIKDEAKD